MLEKNELENKLGYTISEEKYSEICNLEYVSLSRVRTDLTYKKFCRLFVLGRAPSISISTSGQKVSCWWCICDCDEHKIVSVRVNNLTSRNSKSCGCLDIERSTERIIKTGRECALDISNKPFGKLIARYPTEKRAYGGTVVWLCDCECGRQIEVPLKNLMVGRTKSCGCLKESYGSFKIKKILKENNINYETEKTFDTCKFLDTNAYARFDFYIDNKYLLEYDGEQHFLDINKDFFRDSFEKRQNHDKYKNEWCLKNNIPLYRISYLDIENVNSLDELLQDKYLTREI